MVAYQLVLESLKLDLISAVEALKAVIQVWFSVHKTLENTQQ